MILNTISLLYKAGPIKFPVFVDTTERGDGGERDFKNNFNDKHMCPPKKYALWQERQLTYKLNNQAFLIISRTMVARKICDEYTLAIKSSMRN
jgi:hypothetical protein